MRIGYISLTVYCPNRCIACPCRSHSSDKIKELSLERIKDDVVYAEREEPLDLLILSGGEPTWHSKFNDIMAYLSKCRFPVSLTTTSERFSDPEFLASVLKVFPVSKLSATTALHSFKPEVHDAMTAIPGSFHRWSNGLLALEKAGVKTTLKHLLCRPTIGDLPDFVRRFYHRFTPATGLYLCALDFSGMAHQNRDQLICSFAELKKNLESALDTVLAFRAKGDLRPVYVIDLPYCIVEGRYRRFFDTGRHAGSEIAFYDAPDYDRNSPREHLAQHSSINSEICAPCIYRKSCQGILATASAVYEAADIHPILMKEE